MSTPSRGEGPRARMVALTADNACGVFQQLEVVMCRWPDLEQCLIEPPPFVYALNRTSLRPVSLPG